MDNVFGNDTLEFLNSLQRFGWRLGLENITKLLDEMGDPQRRFKSLHIGGTNGKGSTAAMLEAMHRYGGYKTGLYTSPHLQDVTERIKVNGRPISKNRLVQYLESHRERIQRIGCTYFEALTAVAFQCFADEQVDLTFVEVGLGGRYDATNVIVPLLSVITEIDLDHTEHLGRTIAQITQEKAGIIKPGVACLSGSGKKAVNAILRADCASKKSPFYAIGELCQSSASYLSEEGSTFDLILAEKRLSNLKTRMVGTHQVRNSSLAIAACELLRQQDFFLEEKSIRDGLKKTVWPARLQKLAESPKVVIDVAHNPAGMRELLHALTVIYRYDRLILVVGLLRDKDYKTISKMIGTRADFMVLTTPDSERALPAQQFADEISHYSSSYAIGPNVAQAFEVARKHSQQNDLICITGSHYVVGEFLKFYKNA